MSLMLSVKDKHFMPSVTNKPFILSAIMPNAITLSAIMLNVIMLSSVMPNVVAPCLDEKGKSKCVRPKGKRDALCAATQMFIESVEVYELIIYKEACHPHPQPRPALAPLPSASWSLKLAGLSRGLTIHSAPIE